MCKGRYLKKVYIDRVNSGCPKGKWERSCCGLNPQKDVATSVRFIRGSSANKVEEWECRAGTSCPEQSKALSMPVEDEQDDVNATIPSSPPRA